MAISFDLRGTPGRIVDALAHDYGGEDVWNAPLRAQGNGVRFTKRQVWFFQAAALSVLARQYNREDALLLEFGTALGFTATLIAQAAPQAKLVTLNPKRLEYEAAWVVDYCRNIEALMVDSQTYLDWSRTEGRLFDLIFVDGDHREAAVRSDLGYWDLLRPGGLILFHDYSPPESARPGGDVFRLVAEFGQSLGRRPDVSVIDHREVGLVGWYR